ncbi:MAG: YggS family pyridoxal phosphate-dependent enzyme [Candidatus Heimdallarchaeaceae archaeon]
MQTIDVVSNYHEVLRNIEKSARKANRDPSSVTLIGVSKMIETERILPVLKEGLKVLGEVVGKDLKEKYDKIITAHPSTQIHVVGKLQSNKVKFAIEKCHLVQSVNREKILQLIDRRARMSNKVYPIFLQVDFSQVENLKGLTLKEVIRLLKKIDTYPNVEVQGIMTIAPIEFMSDKAVLAKFYEKTRMHFDKDIKPLLQFENPQLSMGMSDAYELAVEKGATIVRVGTAIFGPRVYGK